MQAIGSSLPLFLHTLGFFGQAVVVGTLVVGRPAQIQITMELSLWLVAKYPFPKLTMAMAEVAQFNLTSKTPSMASQIMIVLSSDELTK
jgi:hypothetical protein